MYFRNIKTERGSQFHAVLSLVFSICAQTPMMLLQVLLTDKLTMDTFFNINSISVVEENIHIYSFYL